MDNIFAKMILILAVTVSQAKVPHLCLGTISVSQCLPCFHFHFIFVCHAVKNLSYGQ